MNKRSRNSCLKSPNLAQKVALKMEFLGKAFKLDTLLPLDTSLPY